MDGARLHRALPLLLLLLLKYVPVIDVAILTTTGAFHGK